MEPAINRLAATLLTAFGMAIAVSGPVYASVELDVVLDVHFNESCSETQGFYGNWNATVYPDRDRFFEEFPPRPVRWSPESPISRTTVGGPTSTEAEFIFVLFASDGETVLFEREFDVERDRGPRFAIRTTLACDSAPYREVGSPPAAGPASPWPWVAGAAVLLSAGGFALVRSWRR